MKCLRELEPDVAILQEVGGPEALAAIQRQLEHHGHPMPWIHCQHGVDTNLFLGILSRHPIVQTNEYSGLEYLHAGRVMKMQRGVMHCGIGSGNRTRLHVLNVHLKSRREVFFGDEQLMREQEALLVRSTINQILKENPNAQLVLGGDFNDSPGSRVLKILRGHGAKSLTDPELAEQNGDHKYHGRDVRWTVFFQPEQAYNRFDYLLLSNSLKSRINRTLSGVHACQDWGIASDHRPVFVTLDWDNP
ncbi:MAG: endonuclease/exonuclease/phosphatase family protein [Verrucomicrobia bacterium]|nr:endonuclease/exonuclease/phosphatase family protein [Verrucomicrobiota bacterium]